MSEPRKKPIDLLKDPETPLSFCFSSIAKKYYGATSKAFDSLDFERYFFVLKLLDGCTNMTQQCLSEILDIDKASVVRIINYLTDKKLVKRELNPEDRRAYHLVLSPKGKKIVPMIAQVYQDINAHAFKGFNQDQIALFHSMCLQVLENLSSLPSTAYTLNYIKSTK